MLLLILLISEPGALLFDIPIAFGTFLCEPMSGTSAFPPGIIPATRCAKSEATSWPGIASPVFETQRTPYPWDVRLPRYFHATPYQAMSQQIR